VFRNVAGVIDFGYSYVRRFRLVAGILVQQSEAQRRIFRAKEIWRVSTALSALPDRNTSVRVLKTGEGNSDVRTKKHPKPKRNHTYEQANPNLK